MDTKPSIKNFIIVILPAILTIFIIFFLVMPQVKKGRVENMQRSEQKFNGYNNNDTVQISKDELPTNPKGKLKAVDCKFEQRDVDACIEIYQPVCGQIQVECIKAPCDPVKQTFENYCKACANERVISYTEGECMDGDEVKY